MSKESNEEDRVVGDQADLNLSVCGCLEGVRSEQRKGAGGDNQTGRATRRRRGERGLTFICTCMVACQVSGEGSEEETEDEGKGEAVVTEESSEEEAEGEAGADPGGAGDSLRRRTRLKLAGDARVGRAERRARRALAKLPLRPLDGFSRVVLRRRKKPAYVIDKPEVYKYPLGDTYLVFGDAKLQPLNKEADGKVNEVPEDPEQASSLDSESDGLEDLFGIDKKDVEMVMSQANVSRTTAVRALRKNRHDIFNTIMDLTL
ncbi:Nascent polypeptide-associated complex subunit alpha [Gryllus bimaculatus]|nr:Nascent polypeptide-associated complex subunit alpha [Gryllus bimaculatus]